MFQHIGHFGAHLLNGSQTHADGKPIENILMGLSDYGFEAIGPVSKNRHSQLFGPSMVIESRLHEILGPVRALSHPGKPTSQLSIPLDSSGDNVVLA